MRNSIGGHLYRNIANAASVIGVLPLALLFLDGGYGFLFQVIIFNNVMDDLDGILAAKLNIKSRFGANLDNVCDAIVHVTVALVVGADGEFVRSHRGYFAGDLPARNKPGS